MEQRTLLVILIASSAVVQSIAAITAFRMISVSGRKTAWIFISIALSLMAVRRLIPAYYLMSGINSFFPDPMTEFIGLVLSVLMLIGVAGIKPVFSERLLSEMELKRTKEESDRVFEAITDPLMVVDIDFRILKANKAMMDKLGSHRIPGEMLTCFKSVHGLDEPPAFCPHMKLLKDGNPHYTEIHDDRLGGDFFVSVSPLRTNEGELYGSVHYVRDINERKRAERALKESEAKLRALAETAADAITMIDSEGNVAYWNPAAEKIFGYSAREVLGKSLHLMLAPERFHEQYRKGFARYQETGTGPAIGKTLEMEAVRKDGVEIPVEIAFSVTLLNEKRHAIGIIRDISERKRVETERIRLEEELRQAQKMEAIGQLAGGIAHDFNNILMAIIGFSSIMKMKLDINDPLQTEIDQIQAASDRAAQLTRGLLAYSRKQIMTPKPVDLNVVVMSGEKFLRRVIGEDVVFSTSFADKPLNIYADSIQIEQVLMNLATNARDAMPRGGNLFIGTGLVEIDDGFIDTHGFGSHGLYALLTFSDSGAGMDEQTARKIFEPFFTTKEVGKGTGLGLSVVYGIIKQHSGFITCDSDPGRGTSFRIYLPIIPPRAGKSEAAQDLSPARGKETILLADDDVTSREVSKRYLENFGYSVIEASDGEEALNKFMDQKENIDLALLDIIMPGLNGKDVYRRIRETKPDMKFIFMTGYAADIIGREEIVGEGVMVLMKPMMLRELPLRIREVLG